MILSLPCRDGDGQIHTPTPTAPPACSTHSRTASVHFPQMPGPCQALCLVLEIQKLTLSGLEVWLRELQETRDPWKRTGAWVDVCPGQRREWMSLCLLVTPCKGHGITKMKQGANLALRNKWVRATTYTLYPSSSSLRGMEPIGNGTDLHQKKTFQTNLDSS